MTKLNRYTPQYVLAAAADVGCCGPDPANYADLLPMLDVADGLSRVMNNKRLYLRLLASFSGPKLAGDILVAVEGGDCAKVQQTAHTLKGVSANLGLKELAAISLQIETRARAGEEAVDILPALDQEVTAAMAAIERLLAKEEA
jgi:HPt (histidine-containing phosphotransfer) domain-containing protein